MSFVLERLASRNKCEKEEINPQCAPQTKTKTKIKGRQGSENSVLALRKEGQYEPKYKRTRTQGSELQLVMR